MSEEKIKVSKEKITRKEYVLTNINLDNLHYVIRLIDDKEYSVYKEGKKDYIIKNNEKVYLDDEIRKAVLSNIKEYERYGI